MYNIDVTVGDVVSFYEKFPDMIGKLDVETRFGFKKIEAAECTLKNSKWLNITISDGSSIECSHNHRLWTDEWIYAKNLTVGDKLLTKNGLHDIISIVESIESEDLYDLQVEEVHEFYANTFVSHNSTIFSLITFAMFGQTIKNVTKNQIVNSINGKGCLVEIEIILDSSKNLLIRRGIKPNIFEIFVDGELINQTSANEYQEMLEKTLIKTTYRTFCQTGILSIENYKPFMSMRAYERRNFVEDILDIRVFTFMNQICKQRMTHIRDELKLIDVQLKSAKQRALLQKKHIDRLDELVSTGIQTLQTKVDDNNKSISELNEKLSYSRKNFSLLSDKNKLVLEELKILYSKQRKLSLLDSTISKLRDHINHYDDNSTCPTCNQAVTNLDVKLKFQNELDEKLIEHVNLKNELVELQNLEELQLNNSIKLQEMNTEFDVSTFSLQQLIKETKNLIEEMNSMSNSSELNELRIELKGIAKEAIDLRNRQSELNESTGYYETMIELFKDTGIKSKIVSQYIPIINHTVNGILEKLDFFVSFNLDEGFNEIIKSRHRDQFTYDSFSAGEKQRIDLALMFTFRHLAGIKNSLNCNLLCLDELLDSSLDTAGIDSLLKIFESDTMKGSNIFVISHRNKELLEDAFDGAYELYREQGFSMLRDLNEV